jgi:hypothetical protein
MILCMLTTLTIGPFRSLTGSIDRCTRAFLHGARKPPRRSLAVKVTVILSVIQRRQNRRMTCTLTMMKNWNTDNQPGTGAYCMIAEPLSYLL